MTRQSSVAMNALCILGCLLSACAGAAEITIPPAQWERKDMVDEGLLRNDSPRGTWALTDKGRKYLTENEG